MTCPACDESRINRWCGYYIASCLECSARALAASPAHFQANTEGKVAGPYKDALVKLFGDDWLNGHQRVKDWAGDV